jgi:hypothetical protein
MKQLGSAITGLEQASQWQTGQQHGGTGSDVAIPYQSRPLEQLVAIPQPWLLPTIDLSTSYLVSAVNIKNQLPSNMTKEQAIDQAEKAMGRLNVLCKPCTPETIANALAYVASVFRAPLPDEMGLKIYIGIFERVPAIAFQEGCRKICTTHKYPNMPLPADLLDACKPSVEVIGNWKKRLVITHERLTKMK